MQRLRCRLFILVLLALSATTVGCINKLSANLTPGSKISPTARYYIVSSAEDDNRVDQLIAKRLQSMQLQATVGPRETIPDDADVIVTYRDRWMWDITMYMLELTVTLRKPRTDFPLAEGHAMHGSMTRRSPEEMVDEVVGEIFRKIQAGS